MRDSGARYALDAAAAARWCAPEMTAALAEHACAAAAATADDDAVAAALGWALAGRAAIGEAVPAAIRALEWLAAAPLAGEAAATGRLLVGLAAAARDVGELDTSSQLVRAVLADSDGPDELRADALIEAVKVAAARGDSGLDDLLDAAQQAARRIGGEAELARIGTLHGIAAALDRQAGRASRAADRARDGLAGLSTGADAGPAVPHVAAVLTLELVRALLDVDAIDDALDAGRAALAWPLRAGTIEPLGWLRLALAGSPDAPIALAGSSDARIALGGFSAAPIGDDAAIASLETAVQTCTDRALPRLEAACCTRLAELYEARPDLAQALTATRNAFAAEQRLAASGEALRLLLTQGGGVLAAPLAVPAQAWTAPPVERHDRAGDLLGEPAAGAVAVLDSFDHGQPPVGDPDGLLLGASTGNVSRMDALSTVGRTEGAVDGELADAAGSARSVLVLLTVGYPHQSVAEGTVERVLAELRSSIEARLPLEGRLVASDAIAVVALLSETDRPAAEHWVRTLCRELTDLWSYLGSDLPVGRFGAAIADYTADCEGNPARLHGLMRELYASASGQLRQRPAGASATSRPSPAAEQSIGRPIGPPAAESAEPPWGGSPGPSPEPLSLPPTGQLGLRRVAGLDDAERLPAGFAPGWADANRAGPGRADLNRMDGSTADRSRAHSSDPGWADARRASLLGSRAASRDDACVTLLDGGPAAEAQRGRDKQPAAELSFAELLAGALAAYRET